MPVNPALAVTVKAGYALYRITSRAFRTANPALHANVVNGRGAVRSHHGARYNYGGVLTVYLAEDLETVLTEKMFYFHREVIQSIDTAHLPPGSMPPFSQTFVLWEIELDRDVHHVLNLDHRGATYAGVYPSLMRNPSQDYYHLKDRRAWIQSQSYEGLRAPSSRSTKGGHMIVLFGDQSGNVRRITPFDVTFSLITPNAVMTSFVNHVTDELDFRSGSVEIPSAPAGSSTARVAFNH